MEITLVESVLLYCSKTPHFYMRIDFMKSLFHRKVCSSKLKITILVFIGNSIHNWKKSFLKHPLTHLLTYFCNLRFSWPSLSETLVTVRKWVHLLHLQKIQIPCSPSMMHYPETSGNRPRRFLAGFRIFLLIKKNFEKKSY